uniref:Uncharacterized protein n=1 Tax=Triticum urartu TaxID=4572 RepID=A0A8R7Q3C0_TRIUA
MKKAQLTWIIPDVRHHRSVAQLPGLGIITRKTSFSTPSVCARKGESQRFVL